MPQFVLAPTERTQFLYLRQFLPLAICLACAIFLLASLVAPKGGRREIIGYEYRCADEFDRAKCADVPIYKKGPSGLSAFSVLVLPAMFIGLGSLVWRHQWRRHYKDHLHILASYAEAERES